jgi:hypothetical protein
MVREVEGANIWQVDPALSSPSWDTGMSGLLGTGSEATSPT